MKQQGRNVAASVQTRLLQLSRNSKLSLQDLLERYCTERLLYRLSRSPHHSRFILKGAMLLIVWGEGSYRGQFLILIHISSKATLLTARQLRVG